MADEGAAYAEVLASAQRLGVAQTDPAADLEGGDAADTIAILAGLAFGGARAPRRYRQDTGIDRLDARDLPNAAQLGFIVKLLAVAEHKGRSDEGSELLDVRIDPALLPKTHPLAGVHEVSNAILAEADQVGDLMFYGTWCGRRSDGFGCSGRHPQYRRYPAGGWPPSPP